MTLDETPQVVKLGQQTLDKKMTRAQAQRYGERHMPPELRRAGFKCVVAQTRQDIHDWTGLRINYGK